MSLMFNAGLTGFLDSIGTTIEMEKAKSAEKKCRERNKRREEEDRPYVEKLAKKEKWDELECMVDEEEMQAAYFNALVKRTTKIQKKGKDTSKKTIKKFNQLADMITDDKYLPMVEVLKAMVNKALKGDGKITKSE